MRQGRERHKVTSALVALGFAGACSGSAVDDEESRHASSENATPSVPAAKSPVAKPGDADAAGGHSEEPNSLPPSAYDLPQPAVGTGGNGSGGGGDSNSNSDGDGDDATAGANGAGAAGAPAAWCDAADDPTPVPMSCGVSSTTSAYRQTQLGLLSEVSRTGSGYSISRPLAFNNHGVVVGHASLCLWSIAFIYRDGAMVALETPPQTFNDGSSAAAITDAGDVLGTAGGRPFVWRDGIPTPLAGFTEYDSVNPVDMNSVGQVLGYAREGAFVWDAGEITYLPEAVRVAAINDQGQVAGSLPLGGAFVWEDGVMTMLPDLPGAGDYTSAWDINEAGQVVGVSYVDDRGRAVLWENGVAYDITPPLNGALERAIAIDINEQGVVLGYLQEHGPHLNGLGFLYDHGTFTRIMPEAPFTAVSPVALNDVGEVLGRPLLFNGAPGQATIWSQGCFDTCCH